MKLQSSYIFLKNPYRKEETNNNPANGTIVLPTGKNLYSYIKASFPTIVKANTNNNFYKKKYTADIYQSNIVCKVEFIITEVIDTKYLDIIVNGKTKAQLIKCLEYIQYTLLNSGVRERYIDIISYDAISEYYCNKIYPKLNTLERNLRKLLFNIYIVNFGRDYYKITIDSELQGKIKGVINIDSNKEEKDNIKTYYNANTKKEAEEIERLQRFFYSFEYNDIQKLLFTSNWTSADENDKSKFLSEHKDLSELSDEKLRTAFSKFIPKSDWERFFSNKIDIPNIKDLIEQIRLYRNSVAHFKFFYKSEYNECNKLVNHLNSAIIKAIKITEEKDFAEKNAKALSEAVKGVLAGFADFSKSIAEMAQKAATIISPALTALSQTIKKSTAIYALGNVATNATIVENSRKKQELFEKMNLATSLVKEHTSYINTVQSHLDFINKKLSYPNFSQSIMLKYDIPKLDYPKLNSLAANYIQDVIENDYSIDSENTEKN